MKVTVVGAGALGLLISAILTSRGVNVVLLTRREDASEKINKEGVKIINQNKELYSFPICTCNIDDISDSELLVFTVKAYDTLTVARMLSPRVNDDCLVLTIQNGFNNLEELTRVFNVDKVIGGVTTQAATLININTVYHAHSGLTIIGKTKNDIVVKDVANYLTSHGVETKVTNDIVKEIYSKGVINCVINPITALTGVRNGGLLKLPWFNDVAKGIIGECVEVAKYLEVALDEQVLFKRLCDVIAATRFNKSSMLQDIENARKTEIEQLNGWIVRKAEEFRMRTPLNKLLTTLVKLRELRLISNLSPEVDR